MLRNLGIDPDLCDNGEQAVEKVKQRSTPYDLILMDGEMPVVDGFSASKMIRQLPLSKQPTIVALSAHALDEYKELAEAAGMDRYLTKPVQLEQLKAIILAVCTPDQSNPFIN